MYILRSDSPEHRSCVAVAVDLRTRPTGSGPGSPFDSVCRGKWVRKLTTKTE